MPNPAVVAAEDDVVPPFHAAAGACAPVAVLRQCPHPAQRPGLPPRRRLDHVRGEPLAPHALPVGPLGRLAPAAGRLALDLPDVVLPNVARLVGRIEEGARGPTESAGGARG